MSDTRQPISSRRPRSRVALALAATFGLVLALVQGVAGPAAADPPPPEPTSITVEAFTDPAFIAAKIGGAPAGAIPAVLAATGDDFLVEVSLWAEGGTVPAGYKKDTDVSFSVSGPGGLSISKGTIPKRESSAVFTASYSAAAAGVEISASVGKGQDKLGATSNAFDVNRTLAFLPQTTNSLQVGADGADCTTVDADTPLCGIVTLPNGTSSGIALSLGECPSSEDCKNGSLVTQLITELSGLYERDDPARMELVCDKTMCGKGGVPKFTALWSTTAAGTLTAVEACSAKDVIDGDLDFCTDYRSSHRDNAGDLHLIVLFLTDVRGSI